MWGLFRRTPLSPEKARAVSVRSAARLGIKVLDWLPLLEQPRSLRAPDELADRIAVLNIVVATAHGLQADEARSTVERNRLTSRVSPLESEFLDDAVCGDPTYVNQAESILALAWCGGIVRSMRFQDPCPDSLAITIPSLREPAYVERIRVLIRPRSMGEVLQAADLAFCLHNAAVQAHLSGGSWPKTLPPDRVIYRRLALEWMLGADEWDDVPMDT